MRASKIGASPDASRGCDPGSGRYAVGLTRVAQATRNDPGTKPVCPAWFV